MKRFIECLLPVTVCNLSCSYCYVMQEKRKTNELPLFKYKIRTIAAGLSKERLGGCSYISICGAGETLIPEEVVKITHSILDNGHFVNLTTNGTQSKRFDQLLNTSLDNRSRLNFSFSFHYLELLKHNLLEEFFKNIKKIRKAGCSFVLQLNMCDEYIPYIDEIISISVREVGAPPQLAVTRNTNTFPMTILTNLSKEDYYRLGEKFKSPLFDFTFKNFGVKRNEYCYAGKWTGVLNLGTGELRKCYSDPNPCDIFKDISKPINFQPMLKSCVCDYCINSSHFMSLGVFPFKKTPTYEALRNRREAGWYSPRMKRFLSGKLLKSNLDISFLKSLLRW